MVDLSSSLCKCLLVRLPEGRSWILNTDIPALVYKHPFSTLRPRIQGSSPSVTRRVSQTSNTLVFDLTTSCVYCFLEGSIPFSVGRVSIVAYKLSHILGCWFMLTQSHPFLQTRTHFWLFVLTHPKKDVALSIFIRYLKSPNHLW
jgi:hypothetical protein